MCKIKCKKCGDVIQSKYYGDFCSCSCGSVAIDQTEYYVKISGDKDDIEEVE
ncbi:MAG: DUF7695 domain-containing protein [Clostridium sp.]|uniref:DUF7695 domain-containing protein n=1 Tax=Clostridium sp. TaxID=1506 RepID=UPI003EE6F3A6